LRCHLIRSLATCKLTDILYIYIYI